MGERSLVLNVPPPVVTHALRVSFEEYVLISTREPLVETFRRASDRGVRTDEGLDAVARLESVGLDLPLKDRYADVEFGSMD